MKTKEEIEQLATNKYGTSIYSIDEVEAFKEGYTQCQEDMANKKYTEEDIRKAIQVGISAEAGDYPEGFTYKLGISLEDYYILELLNSLNKQD
jgi:hypothetical protein